MKSCPECGAAIENALPACACTCSCCGASWDEEPGISGSALPPVPAGESADEISGGEELAAVLGSRYELISRLGTGAVGEVFKARDTMLDRLVAIKRVRLDALVDESQMELVKRRFLREAQVAAQLNHPNIVTIHDIVSGPTMSLIIMEFIDGFTLESLLTSKKRLGLTETADILSQVADALDHAHQHKVVHRDVKPANIMITAANEVRVTDFGIAKGETSSNLTVAGSLLGTPNYMSPEQARGGDVDGRSDLFSLGCVLYECLAGMRPFQSETLTDVLIRIVSDAPSPVDCETMGLPLEVRNVLDRALAKDPAKRYGTGTELIEALRSIDAARSGESEAEVGESDERAAPTADTEGRIPSVETHAQSLSSTVNSLMEEVRSMTEIEPYLNEMLQEERLLGAANSSEHSFQNVQLSPQEAFIFSLVDGKTRPREIIAASPLPEHDTARALLGFLRAEFIVLEGEPGGAGLGEKLKETPEKPAKLAEPVKPPEPEPERAQAKAAETARKSTSLDEKTRTDIDHVFQLSQSRDHWEVLGLENGASRDEIKHAFQKKAFSYHPDRFQQIDEAGLGEKLSKIVNRLNEAYAALSRLAPPSPAPQPAPQPMQGTRPEAPSAQKTSLEQARALFQRAMSFFTAEKYWEAIELCRSAIELEDKQADYYHLLGMALSQNPKWRYEAEENFAKASELQPTNAMFLTALGEFYQREGMSFRAKRIFDRVKAINPTSSFLKRG